MFYKLLILFAIIFVYKLICSIINLIKIKYYEKLYYSYLNDSSNLEIFKAKASVIDLFKKANVQEAFVPVSQPVGYGHLASFNASSFTTFPSNLNILVPIASRHFLEAIGTFKARIFECFSPLYWINSIIFLPRNLLTYLNVSAESIFIKIFQIMYWALGIAATLFSNDIATWLKSFIYF